MEIKISSNSIDTLELKTILEGSRNVPSEVEFKIKRKNIQLREIDPTILVAVVGAASTAIGALITGILSAVKEKQLGTVTIESKDGIKIEIPANYPLEKLDEMLEKVKRIEASKIIITK